ncbi:L-fuconolactonase [Saccharothrix ecbatanensis]|uniref:L-fuconolactonase n=1 Tax=Saccharothrix ecbatanensis TaxID=1105145 RepID=A0A7W9HJJ2_9PSEU|nr:amidohydrolase family protein [Saccharothrix ecbatanensis]MBB5803385.1 L-fuconolactonase [Saccharothrix ecbatanensis]
MIPLIDAHQHIWDTTRHRHSWLDKYDEPLNRTWTPADLAPLAAAAGVVGTVAVQSLPDLDETLYLLEQAEASPLLLGVVGWVDLRSSRVAEQIESLLAAPGGRWLRGVRYNLSAGDESEFADPALAAGLRVLGEFDLAFDLLTAPAKLGWTARLLDAAPDTRFVLDHAGNPDIARGQFEGWASSIGELARRPHLDCKLSGLVTKADHDSWTVADLRPYAETVIGAFTPERVAIGSDWPVCLLAGGYERVMGAYRALVAELSDTERDNVVTATVERTYRLAST